MLHKSPQSKHHKSMHPEFPFFLSLFLSGRLTVIGIIGHTHGVNKANSPPKKPVTKYKSRTYLPAYVLHLTLAVTNDRFPELTGCNGRLNPRRCICCSGRNQFHHSYSILRNNRSRLFFFLNFLFFRLFRFSCSSISCLRYSGNLNGTSVGGRQLSSSQAPYSR